MTPPSVAAMGIESGYLTPEALSFSAACAEPGERGRELLDARLGEHLLVVDRDAEVVGEAGRVGLAARLEGRARAREVLQQRRREQPLERLDPLGAGELARERPVELGHVGDVGARGVGDDELGVRRVPAGHDVVDLDAGRLRERRDDLGRNPVGHEHGDRLAADVLAGPRVLRAGGRAAGHGEYRENRHRRHRRQATLQPVHSSSAHTPLRARRRSRWGWSCSLDDCGWRYYESLGGNTTERTRRPPARSADGDGSRRGVVDRALARGVRSAQRAHALHLHQPARAAQG